ncbi:MAG: hypothetical protein KI792_04095 [Alphaproteobacteria bacterium]|nr:hypothetical protein [Alphaproteobacteria bacterium SS10]
MPPFNSPGLNHFVGETQHSLAMSLMVQGAERNRAERALHDAVDDTVAKVIRRSMAGEGASLDSFSVAGSPTAPAFDIETARAQFAAEVTSAQEQFERLREVDTGIPLERAERPVRLWQRTRDGAEAFKADIARLFKPLIKLNEQLVEQGETPLTAASFKSRYGGIANPFRLATDKTYRAVRAAMTEVHKNIILAERRLPPFRDIQLGVHPDRPNSVPRIRKGIGDNLAGLEAADRLIGKAEAKLATFAQPLRIAELRTLSQSMGQVDEKVIAQGVERFRDPLALEALAVRTGDPALADAVLSQVKAAALDNLSRTMFDHSVNAQDLAFAESGLGRVRGEVRPFRDMNERNRTMIGYQVHDTALMANAAGILRILSDIDGPAGPTIAENKVMIAEKLAADPRVDPVLTARQLDQFDIPGASAETPIPAPLIAGVMGNMGYDLDEAQMRAVLEDQTTDALPERPTHLAPDQLRPKTRRYP